MSSYFLSFWHNGFSGDVGEQESTAVLDINANVSILTCSQ